VTDIKPQKSNLPFGLLFGAEFNTPSDTIYVCLVGLSHCIVVGEKYWFCDCTTKSFKLYIHCESKKLGHFYFYCNFGKWWSK